MSSRSKAPEVSTGDGVKASSNGCADDDSAPDLTPEIGPGILCSFRERRLIKNSGWKAFPPRLPEQPIFYPVVQKEYAYAVRIARDWNVPASGAGFVTQFDMDAEYLKQFPEQVAGGQDQTEYWIPAERLDEFNAHIVGAIEIIAEFRK